MNIQKLTKKQAEQFLDQFSTSSQMPKEIREQFEKDGWEFKDYCMIKRYKKYFIYIEFCIGDFCVYPGSKNNGWLLEKKYRASDFWEAFGYAAVLQERIDNGEHWQGEED